MALLTPLWMQVGTDDTPIEYPLSADREILLPTLFSREGVYDKDSNGLKVSQRAAGANMSVDVAAGKCAIEGGEDTSGPGVYLCNSTSTVNVSVSAPGSGDRTYLISAKIRDKQGAVGTPPSTYEWIIQATYLAGTTAPTVLDGIPLASFTVTSSTTQVTNAMITDLRSRLSAGTVAQTGTWGSTGIDGTYYNQSDPTRPLTWMKDTNGWVTLGGWLIRQTSSTAVTGGTFYNFSGTNGTSQLPPEIRPTGIRDVLGLTANGAIHYAIQPNGAMNWRFAFNTTISSTPGAATWFTFDGITYRSKIGRAHV